MAAVVTALLPRRLASRGRVAIMAATLLAGSSAGVAAAAPAALAAPAAANTFTFSAASLAAHATGRYCFDFSNHSMTGPVIVTALPVSDAIVQVLSTDLEYRSGYGWVYCATLNNTSGHASGTITVTASSSLPAQYGGSLPQATLGAGQNGRYCFDFSNHSMTGPMAAVAEAALPNVTLATVSTDLEDRQNYGWTYCATIRNTSATASAFTLIAQSGLKSQSSVEQNMEYFPSPAGEGNPGVPEVCLRINTLTVPVAMVAVPESPNDIFTVEGTSVNKTPDGLQACMNALDEDGGEVEALTFYSDEGF